MKIININFKIMNKTKPKLGERFGKWEIIDINPLYRKDQRYFKVKCECGTFGEAHWSSLRLGKTTQCKTCARKAKQLQFKIGDVVKGYVIINNIPVIKNANTFWFVRCECGKEFYINGSHLMNPNRWFKCKDCSDKENGKNIASRNGQVGLFRISFIGRVRLKAKQRCIEFSNLINPTYMNQIFIEQNGKCALSGEQLSIDNVSIDRIDSRYGYILGNIQLVTKQVNISKHTLNNEEFLQLCRNIVNNANQQPS